MKGKNIALDWLRCGALVLIVFDHLIGFRKPEWMPVRMIDKFLLGPLELIQYGGALGVSIFFVISGYLLALGVETGKYKIKNLPRKVLQLYIPMVISYISFFVFQETLSLLRYKHYFEQFSAKDWFFGGTLVAYFTDRGDVINGTMWYLIPTFIAYLVVFCFAERLRTSIKIGFINIEMALGVSMIMGGGMKGTVMGKIFSYNWYVYILLFGLLLYYFDQNRLALKDFLVGIFVNYFWMILGVYLYISEYALVEKYIVSVMYAILLLVLALEINRKYALQEVSIITFLSGISYYVYLVHMPYGSLLISMIETHLGFPMAVLIVLVLIWGISLVHKQFSNQVLQKFKIIKK